MPSPLQRLNSVHFAMIDSDLAGMSRKQIAEKFDRTPEGVGMVQKSPLYQRELSRRRDKREKMTDSAASSTAIDAQAYLERHALMAAENQIGLMESMDDSIRLRASESVLNRVLGDKANQTKNVAIMGNDAIKVLIDTLSQVGAPEVVATS